MLEFPKNAVKVEPDTANPVAMPVPPSTVPVLESDEFLTKNDVLCGRGPGTSRLEGNLYFRALVRDFQPAYLVAKRTEKLRLARAVVVSVRHRGGRFLRRNDVNGGLYELGDEKAEAKTLQALREGLDVRATKKAVNMLKGTGAGDAEPGRGQLVGGQNGHTAITSTPSRKRSPWSPNLHPANLSPGDIQEIQPKSLLDSGLPLISVLAAHHAPVAADPARQAPAPPAAACNKPRPPASCKRCKHGSCTKYKQTGCYGYCLKHAKLYNTDPQVRFQSNKKKKIKVMTEPPTVLLNAASIVKSPMEMLAAAGAKDPTLWKCPTFALAMMAAAHQTAGKSPSK